MGLGAEDGGWKAGFLLNLRIWGSRMVFRKKKGEDGFGGNKPDGGWVMGCMEGRMGMLFK